MADQTVYSGSLPDELAPRDCTAPTIKIGSKVTFPMIVRYDYIPVPQRYPAEVVNLLAEGRTAVVSYEVSGKPYIKALRTSELQLV